METINYKVVVVDLSTSSVYITDVPCPHYDVDEVDAFDIANLNVECVEKFIRDELGLDLNFVDYTILSDDGEVDVFVGPDEVHKLTVY